MKRKLISTLLVTSMCVSLLAGCGSGPEGSGSTPGSAGDSAKESSSQEVQSEEESSEAAESSGEAFVHDSNLNLPGEVGAGKDPICKETVPLTIGVSWQVNVEDFETNRQTQWLEEVGNFDLSFKIYQDMGTDVNLEVMAGGKELPDVLLIQGGGDELIVEWAEAGAVVPLDSYIENSAYYLPEAVERLGYDFYPYLQSSDGHMYYLPRINQSLANEYAAKMWMYGPWLEKLELDVPTTPEELREVLRAFVDEDPNGNGEKDEIGLIARNSGAYEWLLYLMEPFQYIPFSYHTNSWWDVDDGQVQACYATEGYREGLKYIRSLFDEGLIDPLSFTNDLSQTKALLTQEEPVVGSFVYASMSDIPTTDEKRTQYVGIAPLIGENGTQYAAHCTYNMPQVGAVITSNCKNPEAAFRLLDYLVSEEMSVWTRWGERGVDWLEPGEDAVSVFASMGCDPYMIPVLPWGQPQNHHWYQSGPYIRQYSILLGSVWNGDPTDSNYLISKIQDEYTDRYPKDNIEMIKYTAEESEVVNPIFSTLDDYVKEMIGNFCTKNEGMDIYDDATWEQYLKQLDIIGLQQAQEIVQAAYERKMK